jgi:Holliday junction resolvase RusA-like endonuclease
VINLHDILNATQAAKVIGCARQELAEKGKRGIWPFIKVITPKESGKTVNRYEINKRDLANYLKIPYEEVDKRLSLEEK